MRHSIISTCCPCQQRPSSPGASPGAISAAIDGQGAAGLQAVERVRLWHARLFEHVAANEDLYKAEEARQEPAAPAAASSGEADMTDAEALMEAGCVTSPSADPRQVDTA